MSSLISGLESIGKAEASIEYYIAIFLAIVLALVGIYFVVAKKQLKQGLMLLGGGAIVYGFGYMKGYFVQKNPIIAVEEGLEDLMKL